MFYILTMWEPGAVDVKSDIVSQMGYDKLVHTSGPMILLCFKILTL